VVDQKCQIAFAATAEGWSFRLMTGRPQSIPYRAA